MHAKIPQYRAEYALRRPEMRFAVEEVWLA